MDWIRKAACGAIGCLVLCSFFAGCSDQSYPGDRLEQSLREICEKEYGIHDLEIKIVGTTIGVFLPLEQLFASDFKESVLSGKVENVENLFEPSEEAMDKVEDVLFSISRVLLSTDKQLDFYILRATDVKNTGLQLVLKGFVHDIKRVRVWDIPRSEYRKRVLHELRLNQSVIWHKTVRGFFDDLATETHEKIAERYFSDKLPAASIQEFLYDAIPLSRYGQQITNWKVQEMRSIELNRRIAVVYAKVQPQENGASVGADDLYFEYLIMLSVKQDSNKISRIIPFQFQGKDGTYEKIDFPPELNITENLSKWNEEFSVVPISLGSFLAEQLTRRTQAIVAADERVHNTVRDAKINFSFDDAGEAPHFSLNMDVRLKDVDSYMEDSIVSHDDMLYLLNLVSREFVTVMQGYQFKGYDYLKLNLLQEPMAWVTARDKLELFRRDKLSIQSLFSVFSTI